MLIWLIARVRQWMMQNLAYMGEGGTIPWGGGTPILGHGMDVPRWWPLFWGFSIRFGPYFIPQHNPIDPLFLQKTINLFLSHLVPEILVLKVGLIFTEMYYLTDLKHFVSIFNPIDPPFSLILLFFDPSFSQNLRSDWVQFFLHAEHRYRKVDDVPPWAVWYTCLSSCLSPRLQSIQSKLV